MNVNNLEKINDIFSDYINFSNVDFAKIYDQYINKTFFTPKEESLLSKAYNEQIKQSIFSNIKYTFSSIENATTTIEYIYILYI